MYAVSRFSSVPQLTRQHVAPVLAGLLAIVAATTAIDVVLHATGVFPPWGAPMGNGGYALALAYRTLIGAAGGLFTARLAGHRGTPAVLTLGIVGTLLALAGAAATWNAGPAFGPKWYAIALVFTTLPSVWVGRLIVDRRR